MVYICKIILPSVLLAEFLGIYILVISAIFLLRYEDVVEYAREVVSKRVFRYNIGFVELALGLGIVLTHNIWEFSYRGVITVIGWMMVLEAIFHLLTSEEQENRIMEVLDKENYWKLIGLMSLLLGLFLTSQGFKFL